MIHLSTSQTQFLNENRPHYDTLARAGFLTNIGQQQKDGLLQSARIWAPAYQANLWCGSCVCDLVKFVYMQYDKWLIENDIHKATFPAQEASERVTTPSIINQVKRTYNRKAV